MQGSQSRNAVYRPGMPSLSHDDLLAALGEPSAEDDRRITANVYRCAAAIRRARPEKTRQRMEKPAARAVSPVREICVSEIEAAAAEI